MGGQIRAVRGAADAFCPRRDTKGLGDDTFARLGLYRTRGEKLLAARVQLRLTQGALAEALGVYQAHISNTERGVVYLRIADAMRLAAKVHEIAGERGIPVRLDWRDLLDPTYLPADIEAVYPAPVRSA